MRLGDIAPDFSAPSTQGTIDFHKFKEGSWAILFSHPEDFSLSTPKCTPLNPVTIPPNPFSQNCTVTFPIIADATRRIATLYDMLDHQDATNVDALGMPLTVRSVFIVDPRNTIRLILTYPASTGRNFDEILRCVDSLQLCDRRKVATPAGWRPGDEVIVHNSVKDEEAEKLFPGFKTVKPYLRTTKLQDP
ncbi:hypothetical protein HDU96_007075 [Phlyctochytrium bullatum]|nr:hypothetical protein HDU96_007075 [Phlyctochytrium bullatum]